MITVKDTTIAEIMNFLDEAERQGRTLVHFSAQRKHILWDTLGA
jgi:hypothetical protein